MDQRSLPLGYSFLGNEPDSVVCCDLDDCQLPMQSLDNKRLNCGHSFHLSCLRDREHGQNRSNQVDPTRLCPICHPLLEARIRELSTTMKRLVPNQIMLSLNDSELVQFHLFKFIYFVKYNSCIRTCPPYKLHFPAFPLILGIWQVKNSVTTKATKKVTTRTMTKTQTILETPWMTAIIISSKEAEWTIYGQSCTTALGPDYMRPERTLTGMTQTGTMKFT